MSDQRQEYAGPSPAPQAAHAEDAIDLGELFSLLWKRKVTIVAVSLVFGILAGVAAFLMTPKYEVNVLLKPVDRGEQLANSSLSRRFGGVASLAGINLAGPTDDATIAIATLKSRHLVTTFIKEENLLPVLFDTQWDAEKGAWILDKGMWFRGGEPPTLWDGHEFFEEDVMRVNEDLETGLVSLQITWTDPNVSVAWADALVKRANAYLQEKAKREAESNLAYLRQQMESAKMGEIRIALADMVTSEMERAMMASVSDEYAFRIVDPAAPPDLDDFTSPKRLLMVVLGILFGGLLGVLGVVIQNIIRPGDIETSSK